jgi:hypothetical protein
MTSRAGAIAFDEKGTDRIGAFSRDMRGRLEQAPDPEAVVNQPQFTAAPGPA